MVQRQDFYFGAEYKKKQRDVAKGKTIIYVESAQIIGKITVIKDEIYKKYLHYLKKVIRSVHR